MECHLISKNLWLSLATQCITETGFKKKKTNLLTIRNKLPPPASPRINFAITHFPSLFRSFFPLKNRFSPSVSDTGLSLKSIPSSRLPECQNSGGDINHGCRRR
ncbi:hypothetical protein NPIL_525941 [Nephila pilipes]|uniref:Uncharacterized protein n=1 Tax=Nephila pilipes TaxID=299642 RepID=A0A8X6U8N4_NEPPI|nr:hypothetical protein NPIL_525941 [Nephila pilipes]